MVQASASLLRSTPIIAQGVHSLESGKRTAAQWSKPLQAFSEVSPITIHGAYSQENVARIATLESNPRHVYSELSTIIVNGAYFHKSVARIVVSLASCFLFNCEKF